MSHIRCMCLTLLSLAFLPLAAMAQIAVQFDTVSVWLDSVEVDTIIVNLPDNHHKRMTFDTTGTGTAKWDKPGDRAYIPFYMSAIFDTVEASASADVDSFAVSWTPLNPLTGALLTAHTSYIIGTASVAAVAVSEVTQYDLPLTAYSGRYALIVRQDDLTDPLLKIVIIFIRIS